MMKIKSSTNLNGKLRAENLLKRASDLLGLKYERIQSMLPAGSPDSINNDTTISIELSKNGK